MMYVPQSYLGALDEIMNPRPVRRKRFTSHSHVEGQKVQIKAKKKNRKTAKQSRKRNR